MSLTDAQRARLDEAFSYRCVLAWVGYGDPLFLGFGTERPPGERHERAMYNFDTHGASWRIDGPVPARWTDEGNANAEQQTAAAESLVDERVLAWNVLPDHIGLRIEFTGGKVLTIEPWPDVDEVQYVWSIDAPDGQVLAVATDGRVAVVPVEMPIRDWF